MDSKITLFVRRWPCRT